jgi:hypothetical protein
MKKKMTWKSGQKAAEKASLGLGKKQGPMKGVVKGRQKPPKVPGRRQVSRAAEKVMG